MSSIRLGLGGDIGAEPPSEFRIFRAGVNDTHKGSILFDDQAAAQVMAAAQEWGVRFMIDLNHDSLSADSSSREDASDARGWFDLEVRNGELWAVNVEWTPDGAERIRSKKQRYISPAFEVDEEGNRPASILNAAICAMPATFQPQDLVAARRWLADKIRAARFLERDTSMDLKTVEEALQALEDNDLEKSRELLKAMIAAAASGETPEGEAPAEDDEAALAEAPEEKPEEDPEMKAFTVRALKFTGLKSANVAIKELERLAALGRAAEADAAKNELATRRGLIAELIKLGVETPALAWEGDPEDRKPAHRLTVESIDSLSKRVEALSAIKSSGNRPSTEENRGEFKLTAEQEKQIADRKMTPEQIERYTASVKKRWEKSQGKK